MPPRRQVAGGGLENSSAVGRRPRPPFRSEMVESFHHFSSPPIAGSNRSSAPGAVGPLRRMGRRGVPPFCRIESDLLGSSLADIFDSRGAKGSTCRAGLQKHAPATFQRRRPWIDLWTGPAAIIRAFVNPRHFLAVGRTGVPPNIDAKLAAKTAGKGGTPPF